MLVNLIGNAARRHGRTAPADASTSPGECGRRPGRAWHVRDHGPGLSAEAQAHLFEPFFTTKQAGDGLGLGLTISRGIVREFGGEPAR